jgi:hypothetical protein
MNKERIDTIAAKVVDMGLGMPALFLLEAHLPLTTVLHTIHLGVAPLALPFLGSEKISVISELLSDRANIDSLAEAIESQEARLREKGV